MGGRIVIPCLSGTGARAGEHSVIHIVDYPLSAALRPRRVTTVALHGRRPHRHCVQVCRGMTTPHTVQSSIGPFNLIG